MGVDNDVCAGPSMAIHDDDEHPSVDESITQIETTTDHSTDPTARRRLWTKLRLPAYERLVSMRPDDARSMVNELLADQRASGAESSGRNQSRSSKRPEDESDVLWQNNEPLSWEALAVQAVKGRGELNLKKLSVQERALVDEAKRTEWSTMEETGSVLLLTGQISQHVQQEFSHRFVDSRFVLTKKVEENVPVRFKARLKLTWPQGSRCHEVSPRKQDCESDYHSVRAKPGDAVDYVSRG